MNTRVKNLLSSLIFMSARCAELIFDKYINYLSYLQAIFVRNNIEKDILC